MSERPTKVFLEQRPYRRRRLIDAARLLPVVGAVALLAPALLAQEGATSSLAWRGIYFFGAWLVLILGTWAISRAIANTAQPGDDGPDHEDAP